MNLQQLILHEKTLRIQTLIPTTFKERDSCLCVFQNKVCHEQWMGRNLLSYKKQNSAENQIFVLHVIDQHS